MARVVLGRCPVCNNKMHVVNLHCGNCNTGVSGEFELDKFSYLSKEEKYFIEVFIKKRGNIKEIEKELGISYPTVRRNLDQVIEALGYLVEKEEPPNKEREREKILERLSKGEISAGEAMELMEEL
ncbi:MAG: DUF2089 domain-containing protein [Peptostreptococcaceae bacterium]|nr:DUF2089 domain-containing protein [Peptostreptococcaceae bacterium]